MSVPFVSDDTRFPPEVFEIPPHSRDRKTANHGLTFEPSRYEPGPEFVDQTTINEMEKAQQRYSGYGAGWECCFNCGQWKDRNHTKNPLKCTEKCRICDRLDHFGDSCPLLYASKSWHKKKLGQDKVPKNARIRPGDIELKILQEYYGWTEDFPRTHFNDNRVVIPPGTKEYFPQQLNGARPGRPKRSGSAERTTSEHDSAPAKRPKHSRQDTGSSSNSRIGGPSSYQSNQGTASRGGSHVYPLAGYGTASRGGSHVYPQAGYGNQGTAYSGDPSVLPSVGYNQGTASRGGSHVYPQAGYRNQGTVYSGELFDLRMQLETERAASRWEIQRLKDELQREKDKRLFGSPDLNFGGYHPRPDMYHFLGPQQSMPSQVPHHGYDQETNRNITEFVAPKDEEMQNLEAQLEERRATLAAEEGQPFSGAHAQNVNEYFVETEEELASRLEKARAELAAETAGSKFGSNGSG